MLFLNAQHMQMAYCALELTTSMIVIEQMDKVVSNIECICKWQPQLFACKSKYNPYWGQALSAKSTISKSSSFVAPLVACTDMP